METLQITNSNHFLFSTFEKLYSISFPIFEQRTASQQEKAFSNSQYHLITYHDNDEFIGFISYWEFKEYIYIEHFAISLGIRGKGNGSKVLNQFIDNTTKIVVLEIDPVIDEVSAARLRFYQKCGFYQNRYPHIHPPYREGNKGHSLIVLTTQREITQHEYNQFNDDLNNKVMK